jgi:hypothetical protein
MAAEQRGAQRDLAAALAGAAEVVDEFVDVDAQQRDAERGVGPDSTLAPDWPMRVLRRWVIICSGLAVQRLLA